MSWQKELQVSGGQMWLRPTEEEDVYNVAGIVESGEEYLIWFQKLRYPDEASQLSSLSVAEKFRVVAEETEPMSTLRLEPRILPIEGPQPPDFLALCERLLAPSPGEKWHGYTCEISLRIARGAQVDHVLIRDHLYVEHQGDFVEFMHMQSPLTFIAHEKRFSFTSREMVQLVLMLKHGWPLPHEASE